MHTQTVRTQSSLLEWGIILLTLATALIHLYLVTVLWSMDQSGTMFLLNGLGYLGLLGALFLPFPFLDRFRSLARIALIVYTLITIVAWVFVGARNAIGYMDKTIEVALVVLLLLYQPGK